MNTFNIIVWFLILLNVFFYIIILLTPLFIYLCLKDTAD